MGSVVLKGVREYWDLTDNLHRNNKCKSQTGSSLIVLVRNVSDKTTQSFWRARTGVWGDKRKDQETMKCQKQIGFFWTELHLVLICLIPIIIFRQKKVSFSEHNCLAIFSGIASLTLYPPCIIFAPKLFSFLYNLPRLILLFNPFAVSYFTAKMLP